MARLRVVLVEDGTFTHGSLRSALEAIDVDVVAEGSSWDALVDQADARSADAFVVVSGSDPSVLYDMKPGHRPAIVVATDLSDVSIAPALENGASAFVPFPVSGQLFHAQARASLARSGEAAKLRDEAAGLRDQLETRKSVERAKGILMDRLGLSEQEAFRKLQKASQDENRKMRDIAESVIRAEKMFGGAEDPQLHPAETPRAARSAS